MTVEILYFDGCPHHAETVARTREVLAALDIDAEVREVAIHDAADAERMRFFGSPSVRIDGADIERGADGHGQFGLGCRMYGGSGIPPRELIVDALQRGASDG